jgi:hypothetical protein
MDAREEEIVSGVRALLSGAKGKKKQIPAFGRNDGDF